MQTKEGSRAQRPADPLWAATRAILLPALRPLGLVRKTNRMIGRLTSGILQFLDLQVTRWGDKDFCINYASLSLWRPREYLVLQPGARLQRANGGEAWLPASTVEEAHASMHEVVAMSREQAIPFFESTKTVEGLLAHLEKERWGSEHHLNFDKACCAAKLGRLSQAATFLERAIDLYREDGRPWCHENIELCGRLLAAVRNDEAEALLRDWQSQSVANLRLGKLEHA